jgi:hypothetical protein
MNALKIKEEYGMQNGYVRKDPAGRMDMNHSKMEGIKDDINQANGYVQRNLQRKMEMDHSKMEG